MDGHRLREKLATEKERHRKYRLQTMEELDYLKTVYRKQHIAEYVREL